MGKAHGAAEELKTLFDRKPSIDTWSEEGTPVDAVEGNIEFRDVHFRYPTRPEQPVLRGLNLTIRPGQYVALVGASGCGKSTTIALLERFYDPQRGQVLAQGRDLRQYNLRQYREQLAIVAQDASLYSGTLRENIAMDKVDGADDGAIQDACQRANIWDFVVRGIPSARH